MEPLQLTDLPWDDVVYRHIFPHLSAVDLCHLRGVSHTFLQLQTEYMTSCTKLDLSESSMPSEVFEKVICSLFLLWLILL